MLIAAWDNDIVTVCSCSNDKKPLGELTPQRFGKTDNPLITVGSLQESGEISPTNGISGPATLGIEADDPRFKGNIDIYAIGESLSLPLSNSVLLNASAIRRPLDSWDYLVGGASFSAPQISALSSYFAGSPIFPTLPPGSVAMDRKKQILALRRTDGNYDTQGAAYNGARESYCADPNDIIPPRAQQ